MSDNKQKRQELIGKVMKDPAFKAELMKNPAAAIEKAIGVKIPAGVTVKVVEDTATVVHLVLPPATAGGAKALSDAELAGAAGGASFKTTQRCDSTAQTFQTCG